MDHLLQVENHWRDGQYFQLPQLKGYLSAAGALEILLLTGMTVAYRSMLRAVKGNDEGMQVILSDLILAGKWH